MNNNEKRNNEDESKITSKYAACIRLFMVKKKWRKENSKFCPLWPLSGTGYRIYCFKVFDVNVFKNSE